MDLKSLNGHIENGILTHILKIHRFAEKKSVSGILVPCPWSPGVLSQEKNDFLSITWVPTIELQI
jgi:hypothetical protein